MTCAELQMDVVWKAIAKKSVFKQVTLKLQEAVCTDYYHHFPADTILIYCCQTISGPVFCLALCDCLNSSNLKHNVNYRNIRHS